MPGETDASAAALGRSLTERGETDAIILATGTYQTGDPAPDFSKLVVPGTTLAFYMAVGAAQSLKQGLVAKGVSGSTQVHVAASVSTAAERLIDTTLDALPRGLRENRVTGSEILVILLSKRAELVVMPREMDAFSGRLTRRDLDQLR